MIERFVNEQGLDLAAQTLVYFGEDFDVLNMDSLWLRVLFLGRRINTLADKWRQVEARSGLFAYNRRMNLSNRSMLTLTLLWTLSLFLFPLLLLQGLYVRRTALRLPDGEPPLEGSAGSGEPEFRILGLGDSVIAGTGVPDMQDSVTAQLAQALAERTLEKRFIWQAIGVNGDTLADLLSKAQSLPPGRFDLIVVSIGVNDVTRLTGLLRWQLQLTQLIPMLNSKAERLVFLGIPPMQFFTALPQPLRWVLGVRAAMLDKSLRQAADLVPGVYWLELGLKFDAEHLAEDGYHPNEVACREMAEHLADALYE